MHIPVIVGAGEAFGMRGHGIGKGELEGLMEELIKMFFDSFNDALWVILICSGVICLGVGIFIGWIIRRRK